MLLPIPTFSRLIFSCLTIFWVNNTDEVNPKKITGNIHVKSASKGIFFPCCFLTR